MYSSCGSLAELVNMELHNTDVSTIYIIHAKTQWQFPYLPNNISKFCYLQLREDNSYLYKINKSWITAAYHFEITSQIYEKNQDFLEL